MATSSLGRQVDPAPQNLPHPVLGSDGLDWRGVDFVGGCSALSRGIERERKVKKLLEAEGWWCIRAAASLGDADVVALKAGETPRFIEVKSTHRGPFHSFGPQDRRELIDAAQKAGAEAWLVFWPVRSEPRWIPVEEWPTIQEDKTLDAVQTIAEFDNVPKERIPE